MGQTEPAATAEQAVGLYLDGVYIARTAGAVFDLVDLERVEVLRGPQGTLFGRNTTGGAVQLISRKPGDDFGIEEKSISGASTNGPLARASIPVLRFIGQGDDAYLHRQRDGY